MNRETAGGDLIRSYGYQASAEARFKSGVARHQCTARLGTDAAPRQNTRVSNRAKRSTGCRHGQSSEARRSRTGGTCTTCHIFGALKILSGTRFPSIGPLPRLVFADTSLPDGIAESSSSSAANGERADDGSPTREELRMACMKRA